jgi:putative lipoic acid-binding regulatory protein
MNKYADDSGFRLQLSKLEWPHLFPFKFIVPINRLDEVLSFFLHQETKIKMSSKGNYASVSADSYMLNPEKVCEVYDRVCEVKGVIAL